jgi:hypothetical protein
MVYQTQTHYHLLLELWMLFLVLAYLVVVQPVARFCRMVAC